MLFEINNKTQRSVVSVSYIVNLSKLVHVFFFFFFRLLNSYDLTGLLIYRLSENVN